MERLELMAIAIYEQMYSDDWLNAPEEIRESMRVVAEKVAERTDHLSSVSEGDTQDIGNLLRMVRKVRLNSHVVSYRDGVALTFTSGSRRGELTLRIDPDKGRS